MSQVSSLKKGDVILSSNKRPCKVVNISISKPGKHGSAKANLDLADIFTNKKSTDICKTQDMVQIPEVSRDIYFLTRIDLDGYLSLMDKVGEFREDLKIDDERYDELKELLKTNEEKGAETEVTVLSCLDEEKIIDYR